MNTDTATTDRATVRRGVADGTGKVRAWAANDAVRDSVFLVAIVAASVIYYIGRIGFYSDDWSVLGYASMSDQSYGGVFNAIYGWAVKMRPVQFLYLAALYKLFGADPLGYHIVNAIVFAAGGVLIYLVLRELREPRFLALAIPVMYVLLPHYSTDRLWVAAFQAILSMTLFFLLVYSDLRAAQEAGRRRWVWKAVALAALLGSALAYEVFLPLIVLTPLTVWYLFRRIHGRWPWSWGRTITFFAGNVLILGGAVVFKALVTTRAGSPDSFFDYHVYWFIGLIRQTLRIGFGMYGFGLPFRLAEIVRDFFHPAIFVLGGAAGIATGYYLYRATSERGRLRDQRVRFGMCALVGLILLLAGYAIFLTNYNAISTPAGIANRVAIAGAFGIAVTFVGSIGWVASLLPRIFSRIFFCTVVGFFCAAGFIINNSIATFWISAWDEQQAILEEIRENVPSLPSGSSLLLDGICPYIGPAVVFESSWDLQGALMMYYRDYELGANVITSETRVDEEGIHPYLYGYYVPYAYGPGTFVYHRERQLLYRLDDHNAAEAYFRTYNPGMNGDCPPGEGGVGVEIFERRFRFF